MPRRPEGLRLYPPPALRVREIYGDLSLPQRGGGDAGLPFVFLNAVSTLDGSASISGRAGGIGGRADREVMRVLRSLADAVLIGANTLRAERMSLSSEGRRAPEPLAAVLTSTGEVPLENLLDLDRERTLVILPEPAASGAAAEKLSKSARLLPLPEAAGGGVDLREALRALLDGFGARRVLIEGGPRLSGEAIYRHLADELFLTVSPRISREPPEALRRPFELPPGGPPVGCTLLSAHAAGGELFLRYRLR